MPLWTSSGAGQLARLPAHALLRPVRRRQEDAHHVHAPRALWPGCREGASFSLARPHQPHLRAPELTWRVCRLVTGRSRSTSACSSRRRGASSTSTLSSPTTTSSSRPRACPSPRASALHLPSAPRTRTPSADPFDPLGSRASRRDVGQYDRVVIQDILKEIAQTQQVDLNAKQRFKGARACRPPAPRSCCRPAGSLVPGSEANLVPSLRLVPPLPPSRHHQRGRRPLARRPGRAPADDGEVHGQPAPDPVRRVDEPDHWPDPLALPANARRRARGGRGPSLPLLPPRCPHARATARMLTMSRCFAGADDGRAVTHCAQRAL